MRGLAPLVAAAALALPACGDDDEPGQPAPKAADTLELRSPAFRDRAEMPKRFGCDGAGISPPLSWSRVPRGARELAVVVEDRDAEDFLHWTVTGISPERPGLAEGRVPREAGETQNGFGKRGWGGPCPPEGDGPHRYVFTLYAVDAALRLDEEPTPDELRGQIAAHALAQGSLTGRYTR